jgi:hypothetical protein
MFDAVKFVGAEGACVSVVSAVVVAFAVLLKSDILPAASLAFTLKLYVVSGNNPVA